MKTLCILTGAIVVFCAFSSACLAEDRLTGVLVPVSPEKNAIVTRDAALVTLGLREGIIKGDIGSIMATGEGRDAVIGHCAVTKSGYQSSVCEVISARQEIEKGNRIAFPRVNYGEKAFYPFIISMLSSIVESYEPYKRLNVCVYGIFDSQNAVTALSEEITKEMEGIFSQKKRIRLYDRNVMNGLIFYPDADGALISLVKASMKKADIDVLVLGKYACGEDKINLTITTIDRGGNDGTLRFAFPLQAKYFHLSSTVTLSAQQSTKPDKFSCAFFVKSLAYPVQRDERSQLIRLESGGNPFVEQSLQRTDFNLIHPVETKVTIDDEEVPVGGKHDGIAAMSMGLHRIAVSFKRGYYYNESLMYTSNQEVRKVVLIDLTKRNNVVCEIRLSPVADKDAIALSVYEHAERERQVIKPIYRVQSEKTVERFKD